MCYTHPVRMATPMWNPENFQRMLEENQRLLRLLLEQAEKTRRYIFWGRIVSFVYLLLVIAPLIAAMIYLPSLIRNTIGPYQELLGSFTQGSQSRSSEQSVLEQMEGLKEFFHTLQKENDKGGLIK